MPKIDERNMNDGWMRWADHLTGVVESHADKLEKLDDKVDTNCVDIATLKVKAGIWGLMGGAIPVCIGLLVYFLQQIF